MGDSSDKGATSFHFHHDATNPHRDHKHAVKPGGSIDCDSCAEYVGEAQKANPSNFAGWKVEKA